MKVTKTIRSYVEKKVKEKYPKTAEEEMDCKVQSLINKANEVIKKRIEEACKTIIREVASEFGLSEKTDYVTTYNRNSISGCNTETRNKALNAETKREREIENKIEDILVSLELGATKQELEEMLNKL